MTERDALVARWNDLTRRLLPSMAGRQGWPISLDHCFMRVCLDAALGAPWPLIVRRPAIRNLTDEQLADAVRVAASIVERPDTLAGLNRSSLAKRRAARGGGQS